MPLFSLVSHSANQLTLWMNLKKLRKLQKKSKPQNYSRIHVNKPLPSLLEKSLASKTHFRKSVSSLQPPLPSPQNEKIL